MTLDGDYRGFDIATRDPGIAVITFNEPDRLNGLSRGMKRDLTEIMTQAQLDTDTRVVVITGSGRGFCAGDDIFNPTENDRHIPTLVPQQVRNVRNSQVDQYALLRAYSQELIRSILNLDKITIAALNGVTIQIGLSIALACDFRIASTDCAPRERDPPIRLPARRGWPLDPAPAPRARPGPRVPDAQADRVGRGRARPRTGQRGRPPRAADADGDRLGRGDGERPPGRDANAQAVVVQRNRADLRTGGRRHRGQDRGERSPSRHVRRHGGLPGTTRSAVQPVARGADRRRATATLPGSDRRGPPTNEPGSAPEPGQVSGQSSTFRAARRASAASTSKSPRSPAPAKSIGASVSSTGAPMRSTARRCRR